MEENKIDPYQILGFVILMIAFVWYIYTVPEPESDRSSNQSVVINEDDQDLESKNENDMESLNDLIVSEGSDDQTVDLLNKITYEDITIENEDLFLKIDSKGGMISRAFLKKFNDYKGDSLYLINNSNHSMSIEFVTNDGRAFNTKNLSFKPTIEKKRDETKILMSCDLPNSKFIVFEYIIPNKGYMIDFSVRSSGLGNILNDQKVVLNWDLKALRQAKSVDYENRYSQLYYQFEGDDTDYLSSYSDSDHNENEVSWISYGQHFFNMILVLEEASDNVFFESKKMF